MRNLIHNGLTGAEEPRFYLSTKVTKGTKKLFVKNRTFFVILRELRGSFLSPLG